MIKDYKLHDCDTDLPAGIDFADNLAAIDCEMMGLDAQRDRLCLVQVCDGKDNVWLVKFNGTDWDAPNLKALLEDPKITKIFHFGRKDLMFLRKYVGAVTAPVYDTKIASRFCRTYTDKHGMVRIIEEYLGIKVNKAHTTSNWGAPVLSEDQRIYAAEDVIFLHDLKKHLDRQLAEVGRVELAKKFCDFLPARAEADLAGWDDFDIFAH